VTVQESSIYLPIETDQQKEPILPANKPARPVSSVARTTRQQNAKLKQELRNATKDATFGQL